jgi:hypothetical protein
MIEYEYEYKTKNNKFWNSLMNIKAFHLSLKFDKFALNA